MNGREKDILEGVIGILKRELNPPKIILFGSRAKGNRNYMLSSLSMTVSS